MHIEIITTPIESLKETGFGSYQACEDFHEALANEYPNVKLTACENEIDLQAVVERKPNFVVLADKHILIQNGQKIWLSEFFEQAGVQYTGSKKEALQYDLDKIAAKKLVSHKGVSTARFFTASPGEYKNRQELPLPFPLFLKPIHLANGNGVDADSLVYDFNNFEKKIAALNEKFHCPALVETYLNGREFTVAVFEKNANLNAYVLEIIAPEENGIRILSNKVKKDNTEVLGRVSDEELLSKISHVAKKSFRALGARDFGRIDIKMDHHGRCNFIEANLTPGMKKGSSYFPKACELNAKIPYDNVAHLVLQGVLERAAGSSTEPASATKPSVTPIGID